MSLIKDFIEQYSNEYDFYETASRIASQQIDAKLQASGIRAIVTSRAKDPKHLEAKIIKRNEQENKNYKSFNDIYDDIVDLSGVRVALYFAGERDEVDKLIRETFLLNTEAKQFEGTTKSTLRKKFSGYWATHYRVNLRKDSLKNNQEKYSTAKIEIQVASVLMHAWSEVEHDLVYKPMQGELSIEELSILDELNGMVLCGEVALERLQKSIETRVSKQNQVFSNHYDLASFLFENINSRFSNKADDIAIGDVELLYKFLKQLDLLTSTKIRSFIKSLRLENDKRSIAQQIIDQIVKENDKGYNTYYEIRKESSNFNATTQQAIGQFVYKWIILERFISTMAQLIPLKGTTRNNINYVMLEKLQIFDDNEIEKILQIKTVRNYLIHGIEIPDDDSIYEYVEEISKIIENIKKINSEYVEEALRRIYKYHINTIY